MSEKSKNEQIVEFLETLNPEVKDGLDPDTDLLEASVVDSVAMMDLIVWLEETYDVIIDPEDLTPDNFGTVNRMVRYLER